MTEGAPEKIDKKDFSDISQENLQATLFMSSPVEYLRKRYTKERDEDADASLALGLIMDDIRNYLKIIYDTYQFDTQSPEQVVLSELLENINDAPKQRLTLIGLCKQADVSKADVLRWYMSTPKEYNQEIYATRDYINLIYDTK